MSTFTHEYHELARRFVQEHVLVCQTSLVELLLSGNSDAICEDDIVNILACDVDAIDDYLSGELPADEWHELPFAEREKLAFAHGFEPEIAEVFEWWLVTGHMQDALIRLGQPVLKTDFGVWWGRTCTGQAVYLDAIISRIIGAPE